MKTNLAMEIIQPEQFWSVISFMPNPAELLMERKTFYKTIDEMLLDSKIGSHLRLRKDIVSGFPFIIEQGNASPDVYEFVRDNFTARLNWENDVKEFLSAIEYGHSFSEVLWQHTEDGHIVPDSLRNKYPSFISYKTGVEKTAGGTKSVWVPVLLNGNRELTDSYKFLSYRNNPRAENPYGSSDLLMCYWPYQFKQLGWEFWLKAAQKAGVPSLVALFDAPDSEAARKKAQDISDTLMELEGGDGAALANIKELKTLEMSGALRDHKILIDTCNQEISFALTTQSLSTQEGEYGTRAQATVHDENLVRVCHGDAKSLQGVFQTLIDWMVELNFGKNTASPKGRFDLQSYASFEQVMQAVQNKVPISREALYERYKLPRPQNESDVFMLEDIEEQALSDGVKKKRKILRKDILAMEKANLAELESLSEAGRQRIMPALQKNVLAWIEELSKTDKTPSKSDIYALPFPDLDSDFVKTAEKAIATSLLMGMRHAETKLELSDDFNFETSAANLPFEEAADFFKSKVTLPKSEWKELEQKLRFRAFTVARLAECDFIEEARLRILHAIEAGETLPEILADIKEIVKKDGSTFDSGYWETVFRTNIQSSYNAGRLMQYRHNMPPAWELLVIQDERTSDICKGVVTLAGNGRALKSEHPFWKEYGFPPYHFNCRTTFRAVYDYEIGKTTEVSDIPIEEIREEFKLQKGFGGNPIEKESWWKLTPSMIKRADKYGITADIVAQAQQLDMQSYFSELLKGYESVYQSATGGYVQKAMNWKYSEHEMSVSERLANDGHKIYLLPRTDKAKSPDMLIDDELGDIKECSSLTSVDSQLRAAIHQNCTVAALDITVNFPLEKIEKTIRNRLIRTENNIKNVFVLINGQVLKL